VIDLLAPTLRFYLMREVRWDGTATSPEGLHRRYEGELANDPATWCRGPPP
jgi:hypothetical protein